ncbi:MAG: efflux RND transporter permease subunit [Deltaproteobacteria bacterium]|nr:efflux RND transporter permease subunit [Deltaproteobacteria bacterium]
MRRILLLSLRHRVAVAVVATLALIYGVVVARRADLDVFPEFVAAQVTVQTEAPGLAPQQVEQLVTRPVETSLGGAAGLESIRSESIPGLSVVTVVFRDDVDVRVARQAVAESLTQVAASLPSGVAVPKLSPLTSSTMDLLKVGLISDSLDGFALRDLSDWTLKPRLLAVPGVARVNVFGGDVRQIQIRVDPERLEATGLSLGEVVAAARSATGVRGGGFVDLAAQRLLLSIDAGAPASPPAVAPPLPDVAPPLPDVAPASPPAVAPPLPDVAPPPRAGAGPTGVAAIGETVIAAAGGVPVRLRDVAEVTEASAVKVGDAVIQGRPGVLLAISGQYGANTLETTRMVEEVLAELQPSLSAQGVTLVGALHRPATFIELALVDLGRALAIGALLIVVVLLLFLRDWRTALISFVTIPLSLLAAVAVLEARGVTLNTLTLGGFAVALGVLVDDAIIDVENILRRLHLNEAAPARRPFLEVVLEASLEIRSSVVYATLVVMLVFVPVLAMSGVQGRLLAPLAHAFVLAVLASLVVALVVTPALCALLLAPAAQRREAPGWLVHLERPHRAVMSWVQRHLKLVAALLALELALSVAVLPRLGGEFFPVFREGHFVLQVSSKQPGTSLAEMARAGSAICRDVLALGYVASVEQQIGRAELGEDTWGSHRSEFHVELRRDAAIDQTRAQQDLRAILARYAGLQSEVLTFLGDRISETLTGETAQVVVSVVGSDLDGLDRAAAQVATLASAVPGVVDLRAQIQSGTPQISVHLDPARMALYGIRPADALDAVAAAYAGAVVGQVYDRDRVRDVVLALPPALRSRSEGIGALPLVGVDGTRVPLRTVATIAGETGRYAIVHEGGRRRSIVTFNVRGRPVGDVVAEVKTVVRGGLRLAPDTFVEFGGVAEAELATRRDLWIDSAIALALIALCLAAAFRRSRCTWLVFVNLPFALIGSVAAIALTGVGLSIGSLVGLVTVFGISARNAILLLAHYEHLVDVEGRPWGAQTAIDGATERLRPVLMTAVVTALGLVPLALGLGRPGHEIEAPMAIAVLGGLATSTLLTLGVLPALALALGLNSRPGSADEDGGLAKASVSQ